MSLPSELIESLPGNVVSESILAAVRVPGSKGSFGGETWVLELEGGLAAVSRASIFDALAWLELSAAEGPGIELVGDGFTAMLVLRCADGSRVELRPGSRETEQLTQLLERTRELAAAPGEPAPTSAPTPTPEPSALSSEQTLRSEPASLDSSAVLPRRGAVEPPELEQLLAAGRSAELAEAYLWTRGARPLAPELQSELMQRLAPALEARAELELAWSAWDEVFDPELAAGERQRLEVELGSDGPSIARAVAGRARALFEAALAREPEQLEALRGLAAAHYDLDELDAALRVVRRALAGDRKHYETRMLEARILSLLAIESDDDQAKLEALRGMADDFPAEAEALIELADHHEFDNPSLAIEYLREALEREWDELTLAALGSLCEAQGRRAELIELLEGALVGKGPEEAQLIRETLTTTLARRAVPETTELTPRAEAQTNPRLAIVIALVVLLAVLAIQFIVLL